MQTRFVIGGAVILGAMLVMAIATYFANQEAYYTVDELVTNPALYHSDPAIRRDAVAGSGGRVQAAAAPLGGALPEPTGRRMQVRGTVDDATVDRAVDGLVLSFTLIGKDGVLPVVYEGVVPDTFDLAESVTVGGRLAEDGTFVADQLLVQCPSKYEAVPPGQTPPAAAAPIDG